MECVQRLVRCVIDCKAADEDAISARHALDLCRSLAAGFWESSNLQLRQIDGVGPAILRKFASNNIATITELLQKDTQDIERIASRHPPYGRKLLDKVILFPQLAMSATIVRQKIRQKANPEVHVVAKISFRNAKIPVWKGMRPAWSFIAETSNGQLVRFSRGNIGQLEKNGGYEIKFSAVMTEPKETISCYVACEEIVGTMVTMTLVPLFPDSAFMLPDRRSNNVIDEHQRKRKSSRTESDEYGWHDDDDVLIQDVDVSVPRTSLVLDKSTHVDDCDQLQNKSVESTELKSIHEPVQLPNGKWTCNHTCSGGVLLKNGKTCKHKCCVEGLDKPRKVATKASKSSEMRQASR